MTDFEALFDDNYKIYDKVRPEYPQQLFKDILEYKPLLKSSRIMEIGIGTGKATQFFIDYGCQIASVEPGPKMAKFVRNKYKDYDDFSCYNMTFEKYMGMNNTFDLIYSATAFHWLDQNIAFEKSFKLLKSNGVLARFAYHAGKDTANPELMTEIDKLYAEYMPGDKDYKPYSENDAKNAALLASDYGFTDIQYKTYNFEKNFTADEYVKLLSTYPDHMRLSEEIREEFFSKIKKTILKFGNKITINYFVDLQLARKP